jgi:hypothetical protein
MCSCGDVVLAEAEGIVLVYMNRIVRIAFVPKLSLQTNAQLRFPSDPASATLSQRYLIIESASTLSHSNRLSVMQVSHDDAVFSARTCAPQGWALIQAQLVTAAWSYSCVCFHTNQDVLATTRVMPDTLAR